MFFSIRSVDIIHGKLDQRNKQLEVDYTIGRDIKPDDIKKIAATLTEWCDSCESVLSTFESQIDRANAAKGAFIAHNEYIEQAVMHLLHWTTWLWQLNITQYLFTSCFFFFLLLQVSKLRMTTKAHSVLPADTDEEMAMDFKDSNSSTSSNTSLTSHDVRNKRPKPKVMKPTSASGGKSWFKFWIADVSRI